MTGFLEGALAIGFKALAQKLANTVIEAAGKSVAPLFDSFTTDFEPHLAANFDRCSKVKTLINKAEPINILSIYENCIFACGKNKLDDFELIDLIPKKKNVIIAGTGGGGKTVFMKYLWLSLFVRGGQIPVFIELRRINEITSDELLPYIFRSIVEVKSRVTEDQFYKAVHEGAFTFILDGFDEINRDKRDLLEQQILKLAHQNPEAIVIVSGRPDDRFAAWQAFSVFEVQPLNVKQVTSLISKIDYDKKIKKKFIDSIKKDLFKKHPTFLSSPLLATMMLLTFDQFAEIPEKEFLFYEQAFDTLFSRHDATKEGFRRNRYVPLTIDIFKKYFSFFCLFSYFEEKFEFSDDDLLIYLKKAFSVNGASVKAEDFVRDLIESICVMQRNGLEIQFTHRSFQEYFSAYCLANFVEEKMPEILWRMLGRPEDNVIPMLFEMKREKVENDFIVPRLKETIARLNESGATPVAKHYAAFDYTVHLYRMPKMYRLSVSGGNSYYQFITLLRLLYRADFASIHNKDDNYRDDDNRAGALIAKQRRLKKKGSLKIGDSVRLEPHELDGMGFSRYCKNDLLVLQKILDKAVKQNTKASKNLSEILGL